MNREEWRNPTVDEIRVLRKMLSVDFPGCEAYRSQLLGLKVSPDTTDGTTLFLLPDEGTLSATPTDAHLPATETNRYLTRLRFTSLIQDWIYKSEFQSPWRPFR